MKVVVTFTKEELASLVVKYAANSVGARSYTTPTDVQFKLDDQNKVHAVSVLLTEVKTA